MMVALASRNATLLVLALTVLVLAASFCLFDRNHSDGHEGMDLCLGMLVASLVVTLVARLPLTGSAGTERFIGTLAFAPAVPAPPPKGRLF